jgi:K+-sensing histidine kinase KdpD
MKRWERPSQSSLQRKTLLNYFLAVLAIGITVLLCIPLANTQNYHVVSFILLFVVSILSTLFTLGPILLASTLSALVWNFFFIPPHLTFHIEKTDDLLIFGLFFIIAMVNGVLTTRIRRQEQIAREREKNTNALFLLTKELSKANGIEGVLKIAIGEINKQFDFDAFFLLQDGNNVLSSHGWLQKDKHLEQEEFRIAEMVFQHLTNAGAYTNQPFDTALTFYPLKGTRLNPGVLIAKQNSGFNAEQETFRDTFIAQISNALEREFLAEMARKVRFLDESDRLYKTLFNSISHELRIPVATIMGASDTIINDQNPESVRFALCQEIFTASLRLNRLIENLLNMSRLESGHISPRIDWYDINDLVRKVTGDLKEELKPFHLEIVAPDDLPLVQLDFGLMEQVLYNLLFNATQYAPSQSRISLEIVYVPDNLVIRITDQGPGFPEDALPNVFKKFFRVRGSQTGGLGLGLSIVKGFVDAHNGTIKVENSEGGGACFIIRIPSKKPEIQNL